MAKNISPALEGEFEMVGIEPGPVDVYGIGVVDFSNTSLEMAQKVFKERLPTYLRRVKKTQTDRPPIKPDKE
ncbi:hypothetical protein [Siphonobacter sp. SORGH_AS_0500]|uniref:hypothetical protein n=1 Tax=Siphonobacter sp. SORGH_AS_0500 TaxID=1864824 RepID=UPI002862A022|nr:hypothetical protein [Siphonobacter sp. SORGH_AS_0500]MDR6196159.1 hypothetical protein [Siphonobacter sp. SORGH_AS_0500]